ncbi:MAG: anthranilate synthase component I family protein [Lutibacter sp.]
MHRTHKIVTLKNRESFKKKLLFWAQQFNSIAYLDSNEYPDKYGNFDAILAVGNYSSIDSNYSRAFEKIENYYKNLNDYIFGYFGYDLKNDIEHLKSSNLDRINFPDFYFFQPKKLFFINNNSVHIKYLNDFADEIETDLGEIYSTEITINKKNHFKTPDLKQTISRKNYIEKVNHLLNHIHRGDVYEVNFCQEFYAENAQINPLEKFEALNSISKPPFASFIKLNNLFLISASPERYLKKEKNLVISQPIKGTAKRLKDLESDKKLAENLVKNQKEIAENVMIVDLVRNDLSRIADNGTVKVDELCKLYTFKQVHQLISTIRCEVTNTSPIDIIKNSFPMGSMTGAPKIAAMKLIEQYEETKRGLYSGAVGYFTPNHNFDFNVIIRSILYNQNLKTLSFSVGGAITSKSDPEKEYEECLIKAKALKQVLLQAN